MACFIVPAGEALVVTCVSKVVEKRLCKKYGKEGDPGYTRMNLFIRRRKWLTNLLWGGSALLAFEHLWHGEIVPWYPWLTAAYSAQETEIMLQEMATTGVMMALLVTSVWIGMVVVSERVIKRQHTKVSL